MSVERLAYCSPLPPQASGIADYSAELLPALARHVGSVELFVAGGRPLRSLCERFAVRPLAELPRRRAAYDAILYHLGNDLRFHGRIYETALAVPGVVVLHEYMLHHLVRGLTVDRGRPEAYVAAMRACYGDHGARTARRFLDLGAGRECWRYPLFELVADASCGLVVHSRAARARVLASRPDAAVAVVPHHLALDCCGGGAGDRAAARGALGMAADALVVGSFGFLTESKRLEVVLASFAGLRRRRPDARLVLVGDPSPHPGLERLLASELGEGVICTGRVGLEAFLDQMRAVDVAVNLRHPTGGETSGTVIRLLGLGLAVVVSDVGAFAEIPDACCLKVAPGEGEEEALLATLLALADEPELRRRLGENARRYMAEEHSLERSAAAYGEALATLAGRPPLHPVGPPTGDPLVEGLVGDLGAALCDLGIAEDERELLADVAAAVSGLGIA